MYRVLITILVCLGLGASGAAQKINPNTQINWPIAAGNGAPTALVPPLPCGVANVGQPYTDTSVLPNQQYMCEVASSTPPITYAWTKSGGCIGLSGSYNFTNQVATISGGCVTAVGNPFAGAITSAPTGPLEVGNSTTNLANFTFAYTNGTPASGTISDGIGNTVTLTSPYTSGSIAQAYCTAGQGAANFTFTLHATSTTGQTTDAGSGLSCGYRVWVGIGGNGATGVTVTGTTATLAGASGTLTTQGLGNGAGTYNFTPGGLYLYFVTPGVCSRTYTSGGFTVPVLTTVITVTNGFGAASSYCLAQTSSNQNLPITVTLQ